MKSNKQSNRLSLLAVLSFALCGVLMAQEAPPQQRTIIMTRSELADKAKRAVQAHESRWRLTKQELVGVRYYQVWKRRKKEVRLEMVEKTSTEDASASLKSSLVSSEIGASTLDGLGDEAGYLCFLRSRACTVSVRKGKVVFIVTAPSLELAKRFVGHLLTIDDTAMKTEN